jgi:hypothetical protein
MKNTDYCIVWATCAHLAVGVWVGSSILQRLQRRPDPVRHGDAVAWQGDTVSLWDYCWGPGAFDNDIGWVSPTGQRQTLAHVGDADAELTLLPDGRFQACFYDETSGTRRPGTGKLQYLILTWRDLRSPPTKQVVYR